MSPGFEFKSCFLLWTGHTLSKSYFHQQVLEDLASSLLENQNSKCQMKSFVEFMGYDS